MPRDILGAHQLLAEVERGLEQLVDKPALMVRGDKDPAVKEPLRLRSGRSRITGPRSCAACRPVSRRTRPVRSSPR
jgi:hypothetical protein